MKPKTIPVKPIATDETKGRAFEETMNCWIDRVRARAYEIFERRNRKDGHDLDDWFQAEQELGMLTARIKETENEIQIRLERPDFNPGAVTVKAEPQAIMVEDSDVQGDEIERMFFGRYELPAEIDTGRVTATLKDGGLEIVAKKACLPENGDSDTEETEMPKIRASAGMRSAAA